MKAGDSWQSCQAKAPEGGKDRWGYFCGSRDGEGPRGLSSWLGSAIRGPAHLQPVWGISPPVPVRLGGGVADGAGQGRRSAPIRTLWTSRPLRRSLPAAFLPRRGPRPGTQPAVPTPGSAKRARRRDCSAPPAAPPSTPGSSSPSSSFPGGGGSRLRKPQHPRPGRLWRFGEGGPRGSAPRGT